MGCVKCNRDIISDEDHYFVEDLGPELSLIIEQEIAREITLDAVLCEACFITITNVLANTTEVIQDTVQPEPINDRNVCIWCLLSLERRRAHVLTNGPQKDIIATRIVPRQVPEGGRICHRCWTAACRLINISSNDSNRAQNTCVWCRRSVANRRTHSMSDGAIWDEISARIAPRQILPGDQVCFACWVSARRNVQRANNANLRRNSCAVCSTSTIGRRTHLLSSSTDQIRDVISRRIHPREITNYSLVCHECWVSTQDAMQENEQLHVSEERPQQALNSNSLIHHIQLRSYYKIGTSSASCFVPRCTNTERLMVPRYLKKNILSQHKIYISDHARICMVHKTTYDWDHILNIDLLSNVFTVDEIEDMMAINNDNNTLHINFSNIENIDSDVFKYWTGLTHVQFSSILNELPHLQQNCKIPKTALGLYLVKARTGESHERLATLFRMSKGYITRLLTKAREALKMQYVPKYIGLGHIQREDIINKNLIIPEGLFGNREERRPIIIFDGTYIYIQKSSNYLYQKLTYSLHKYRNLVKPFLLVACDGHIVDICGPYPASMSDADIMKSLFQNENGPYRQYFRPEDIFILDRGFRDALPLLENIYKVYKPESMEAGETQLTTIKANQSRLVTMCRWVVEVVNGRFKLQFKLFRNEYFNIASSHLMDDFKICAAILNAFHSSLVDRPDAEAILNRALQRVNVQNTLGSFIIENNINRRRANFLSINESHPLLEVFPQMTMSNLILFALGIYQIKQARNYYGEHIRRNGSFVVELCSETMVPGTLSSHEGILIRGRIKSRHHSNKIYYTYVLISSLPSNWETSIEGYYCSCVSDSTYTTAIIALYTGFRFRLRTVGCCAHVMTVVWYLGWARYQSNIEAPASFLDDVLILEGGDEMD